MFAELLKLVARNMKLGVPHMLVPILKAFLT
jgi:hypothetical protein